MIIIRAIRGLVISFIIFAIYSSNNTNTYIIKNTITNIIIIINIFVLFVLYGVMITYICCFCWSYSGMLRSLIYSFLKTWVDRVFLMFLLSLQKEYRSNSIFVLFAFETANWLGISILTLFFIYFASEYSATPNECMYDYIIKFILQ